MFLVMHPPMHTPLTPIPTHTFPLPIPPHTHAHTFSLFSPHTQPDDTQRPSGGVAQGGAPTGGMTGPRVGMVAVGTGGGV